MKLQPKDFHVIVLAAGCSRRLADLTADKPKSFLQVRGKRIIDHLIDSLTERGFVKSSFVIGYLPHCFLNDDKIKNSSLDIDFIVNEDYEKTGHAWSLYLTRSKWKENKRPVILIHADIFFNPKIIDLLLTSPFENVLATDEKINSEFNDKPIAYGGHDIVKGIKVGGELPQSAIGEVACMNKWSSDFMEGFFNFMGDFFDKNGNNYNWEPVCDQFLKKTNLVLNYANCGHYHWVNINRKTDLDFAENIELTRNQK